MLYVNSSMLFLADKSEQYKLLGRLLHINRPRQWHGEPSQAAASPLRFYLNVPMLCREKKAAEGWVARSNYLKNLISGHAEGLNAEGFSMSGRSSGCGGASEQLISSWGDCVHFAGANKYKWQRKGCCSLTQLFSWHFPLWNTLQFPNRKKLELWRIRLTEMDDSV